jgi:hypothetical protein|tara:strand:- start:37 stop:645 length:609 start_codon:yes stop_codon:yes gene_type:complete
MKGLFNFIISPIDGRYNNEKKVGDSKLIVNTNIEEFVYINRMATVISIPTAIDTNIKKGDIVVVHHNIFRRWYDVRGNERNSRNYFTEDLYFCPLEQIYLYKQNKEWITNLDYCFIKPVRETDKSKVEILKQQKGVLKYTNSILTQLDVHKEDVVGFNPMREWEFIIDGQLLYCMKSKDIVIKYDEYKGNETEYNPSWAQSS